MTAIHADIRPAHDRDVPILFGLAQDGIGTGFAEARTLAVLAGAEVFVADVDGIHAGYVAVSTEDDSLVVRQLFVVPAAQAAHLGHQLLDWAEGLAISRGLAAVAVDCGEDDYRSAAFYARRGYVRAADRLTRDLPG